jgi:septal ring-binding cell division protein DamX
MNKSQLRRLALDHAQGEIAFDDYVREREELIDAISTSKMAIERETPKPIAEPGEQLVDSNAETLALPPASARSLSPVFVGVGVVVVLGIAWLLLSSSEEPPLVTPPAPAPVVTVPTKPPAEVLVAAFVAENNWNESSTQEFLQRWRALPDNDRVVARSAPWFNRLVTALRQEINARHALAGLTGGGADRVEGIRLVSFARSLELNSQFPDFGDSDTSASDDTSDSTGEAVQDTTSQTVASFANVSANAASAIGTGANDSATNAVATPAEAPAAIAAASPSEQAPTAIVPTNIDSPDSAPEPIADKNLPALAPATARAQDKTIVDWFAEWPDDQVTLQLHVVSSLGETERMIAQHPGIDLRVLESRKNDGSALYRIVHGLFADAARAKQSYADLPAEVRKGQDFALVKSVQALREAGAHGHYGHLQRQFTVQLFVLASRDNADKVVARYPNLPLWQHQVQGSSVTNKHRVLFGYYASAEEARTAAKKLPSALLREADSTPVVKRADNPDSAAVSR